MIIVELVNDSPITARGVRLPLRGGADPNLGEIVVRWLGRPDQVVMAVRDAALDILWPLEYVAPGSFIRLQLSEAVSASRAPARPTWLSNAEVRYELIQIPHAQEFENEHAIVESEPPPGESQYVEGAPPPTAMMTKSLGMPKAFRDPEVLRHQMFFRDLEANTLPDFFAHLLGPIGGGVESALRIAALQRMLKRFDGSLRYRLGIGVKVAHEFDEADTRHFADLLRKVIERHFCLDGDPSWVDWADFDHAVERFANGHLHDATGGWMDCEPEGARYFFFAEFAIACLECGINVAFWTRALASFVRTQEVFTVTYGRRTKDKPWLSFSSYDHRNRASFGPTYELARGLRAAYGFQDRDWLEQRATENARRAFPHQH